MGYSTEPSVPVERTTFWVSGGRLRSLCGVCGKADDAHMFWCAQSQTLSGASARRVIVDEMSAAEKAAGKLVGDGAALLSADSEERKNTPIYSGVMRYFPRALAYIAKVSKAGNDKHNPGQPLQWSKDKSNDHLDCVARHLTEAGTVDPEDDLLHDGKLAWRALANLETILEKRVGR